MLSTLRKCRAHSGLYGSGASWRPAGGLKCLDVHVYGLAAYCADLVAMALVLIARLITGAVLKAVAYEKTQLDEETKRIE